MRAQNRYSYRRPPEANYQVGILYRAGREVESGERENIVTEVFPPKAHSSLLHVICRPAHPLFASDLLTARGDMLTYDASHTTTSQAAFNAEVLKLRKFATRFTNDVITRADGASSATEGVLLSM